MPTATNESANAAEDIPVDIDITTTSWAVLMASTWSMMCHLTIQVPTARSFTMVMARSHLRKHRDLKASRRSPTQYWMAMTIPATATVTITVAGDSEPTVMVTDLTVNEDGLANGTAAATDSEIDASGVMTIDTGADSLTQVEIQMLAAIGLMSQPQQLEHRLLLMATMVF